MARKQVQHAFFVGERSLVLTPTVVEALLGLALDLARCQARP